MIVTLTLFSFLSQLSFPYCAIEGIHIRAVDSCR